MLQITISLFCNAIFLHLCPFIFHNSQPESQPRILALGKVSQDRTALYLFFDYRDSFV
jgi:hypothetical protein